MNELSLACSRFTGLTVDEVNEIASKAPKTYKKYFIPKKRGGHRAIFHPSKETKLLQYALMVILGKYLQPHECVYGYVREKKSPLRKNALLHSKNSYLIKIDFENFFPSIKPIDLFKHFEVNHETNLSDNDQSFLQNCLFIKESNLELGLPIGAPSSPLISNGVLYSLDEKLFRLAIKHDFIYSRYADDLVFSTDINVSDFTQRLKNC